MIFNAFLFSLKGYSETLSCRLECCNFSKETPEQVGKNRKPPDYRFCKWPRRICLTNSLAISAKFFVKCIFFNETQILFNLLWCAAPLILAIIASLRTVPQKLIACLNLIGIWWDFTCFYNSHLQNLKKMKQMFSRLLLF